MSAICGGGEWGRRMLRCPCCKTRRRALDRPVFSGYGSDLICGGCGQYWQDGEPLIRRGAGQKERSENIARVKGFWPKARHARDVWREALSDALDDGAPKPRAKKRGKR